MREALQIRDVVHSWLAQSLRNQGLTDYGREVSQLGQKDHYCIPTDPWEL